MKTIVLIPIKNEEWILEQTLKNISSMVDFIIIADQRSTDRSLEICKQFPKVKVINNSFESHSNKIRWLLLDEARKIDGNNLIICLDADELLPPSAFKEINESINSGKAKIGDTFSFNWIQLWKSVRKYRIDNPWKNNQKKIAFWDDRKNEYKKIYIINDHTSRIPDLYPTDNYLVFTPLLHFQFVAFEKAQMKQAWYRCSELINNNDVRKINLRYLVSKEKQGIRVSETKKDWFNGLDIDEEKITNAQDDSKLKEIIDWFNKYGIGFFEGLDIWDIKELNEEFIKRMERKPNPKKFPDWLIKLNNVRNVIKNKYIKWIKK